MRYLLIVLILASSVLAVDLPDAIRAIPQAEITISALNRANESSSESEAKAIEQARKDSEERQAQARKKFVFSLRQAINSLQASGKKDAASALKEYADTFEKDNAEDRRRSNIDKIVQTKGKNGVDLGGENFNAGDRLSISFDVRTLSKDLSILVTKRHVENEGSVTVLLTSGGTAKACGDAAYYMSAVEGKTKINDGNWHSIEVVKDGTRLSMKVDGTEEGHVLVRASFQSNSPWHLGYIATRQEQGFLDAEFRKIRIGDPPK